MYSNQNVAKPEVAKWRREEGFSSDFLHLVLTAVFYTSTLCHIDMKSDPTLYFNKTHRHFFSFFDNSFFKRQFITILGTLTLRVLCPEEDSAAFEVD